MTERRDAGEPGRRIPARIFLSYASEDRAQALRLFERLIDAGVQHVWLDRESIAGGEPWKREIDDGLRRMTMLVALITSHSADPSRQWIVYEHNEARRLLKPILPVLAEGDPPAHLADLQMVSYAANDEEGGFRSLLNQIGRHTLRGGARLADQSPPMLDGFVGRESELSSLAALLRGAGDRVVTARPSVAVQGMGGTGKTMIAEELIRRIAPAFPGGVLVVRRGQTPAPARLVLQRWVELATGEPANEEPSPDMVRGILSGFGELLALIDDVAEADFGETRRLLAALPPDATRIVTTRSAYAASELGCTLFPLSRLAQHDGEQMVRNRIRAKMGPSFEERGLDPFVAEIRRLVDVVAGHALSIELAVARCDSPARLPRLVQRIERSLEQGVAALEVNVSDVVTKESSVAVSLALSLEPLREHDVAKGTNWVRRFAALGVLPDGATTTERLIAAVWGDGEDDIDRAEDALGALFRGALIKCDLVTDRYSIHPILRAFATQLLLEDVAHADAIEVRYREAVVALAEEGFSRPLQEWDLIEVELPHVRAVGRRLADELTRALGDLELHAQPARVADAHAAGSASPPLTDVGTAQAARLAVRFADALTRYVVRRPGLGKTGLLVLDLGLAAARALHDEAAEARALRALGGWHTGVQPVLAEAYFRAGLALTRRIGARAEEGTILSYFGELQRRRSRPEQALEPLEAALTIHRETGDRTMEATTLKYLGETCWRVSRLDEAMGYYEEARTLFRELRDESGEADLLNKIASVSFHRGEHVRAIEGFEQALELHRKLNNRRMMGEDLNDMGIAHRYLGDHETALRLLEEAAAFHREVGNRRLLALTTVNAAAACLGLGRPEEAIVRAVEAAAIARELDVLEGEVWAMNWHALALHDLGRTAEGVALLERAERQLEGTMHPRTLAGTFAHLGELRCALPGGRNGGVAALETALRLLEENHQSQAFGGRTPDQLRDRIARERLAEEQPAGLSGSGAA